MQNEEMDIRTLLVKEARDKKIPVSERTNDDKLMNDLQARLEIRSNYYSGLG